MSFNKFRNAFTLIEMLIVIVIIGILASALVPRLQDMQGRAQTIRAITASRNLFNGMKLKELDMTIPATIIWDFEGNGKDKSGMGNDITAGTLNLVTDKSLPTSPYFLSVSGNYLTVNSIHFPNTVTSAFCLSFLMKSGPTRIATFFKTNSIDFGFLANSDVRINSATSFTGLSAGIKKGQRHHVLVSNSGTGFTVWLDGVKKDFVAGTGSLLPSQTTNALLFTNNRGQYGGTHGADDVYYRTYSCNEEVF